VSCWGLSEWRGETEPGDPGDSTLQSLHNGAAAPGLRKEGDGEGTIHGHKEGMYDLADARAESHAQTDSRVRATV